MRYYESIWTKLKNLPADRASKEGVSITAPAFLHRRIIKGVKKEKYQDVEYKIELFMKSNRRATLVPCRNNSIIVFKLAFTINVEDLGGNCE